MSLMTSRVVRTDELARRLGVTRSTIWRWIREGRLPPKHHYGPNSSGWLESELEEWWSTRSPARAVSSTHQDEGLSSS